MDMVFEEMVQRILDTSQMSRGDLMARIRAKQEELGGFVTLEGAANIVARELGIVFERREPEVRALHIEDLIPGMSKVSILARITRVREPREFQRSGGKTGRIASITLQDSTGEVRLALWDDQASLIEKAGLKKGDVVRVQNAYVRQGIDKRPELSLVGRGSLVLSPDDPAAKDLPQISAAAVTVSSLGPEMVEADLAGRVVTASEVRTFSRPDGTSGRVATLVLADRTGQVRVSLWDEWADFSNDLKRGEAVMIENAVIRPGLGGRVELSLGANGRLVRNPAGVPELPELSERPLKVKEVEADMRSLDLAGIVKRKFPPREFKRNDGSVGKVASVVLADDTGNLRASFWDSAADAAESMQIDDVVLLRNAYARAGLGGRPELHAGRATEIEINPAGVEVVGPRTHLVKLGELEANVDYIEAVGRVVEVSDKREFTRSDGSKGRVASIVIGDESGSARVSLWQDQADKVDQISVGDTVRLVDAYTTVGLFGQPELQLGRQGQIEINPGVELPQLAAIEATGRGEERLDIAKIDKDGVKVQVRGTVIQVFHRRPIFDVCPNCGRSIQGAEASVTCEGCGKAITPEHRAVVSLMLDDGTGSMRVALFGDAAERLLGQSSQQIHEAIRGRPDLGEFYSGRNLVGRELIVTGNVRRDKYYDQFELRGSDVQVPDPLREARALLKRLKETA